MNRGTKAKALLQLKRSELAHIEGLIRSSRGQAPAPEAEARKARQRALAAQVDELEGIVAAEVARQLGREPAAASAIDAATLRTMRADKIVIEVTAHKLEDIADLRSMEGFGTGLEVLWSDGLQSILGFVFAKSLWTRSEAELWVEDALKQPDYPRKFSGREGA